jgi:hypothetical protein
LVAAEAMELVSKVTERATANMKRKRRVKERRGERNRPVPAL